MGFIQYLPPICPVFMAPLTYYTFCFNTYKQTQKSIELKNLLCFSLVIKFDKFCK